MKFIIVSTMGNAVRVWCAQWGWREVDGLLEPWQINQGYLYATRQRADAAIRRNRAKYPHVKAWRDAKYITINEARSDDNNLGLNWRLWELKVAGKDAA